MMLSTIILAINLNLSNLTYELVRHSIEPYTNIFGNYFWGICFGFVGASIYAAGSGDSRIYLILTAYLIGVGIIFAAILDYAIVSIFGLLLAFLVASILYKVFVEPRD